MMSYKGADPGLIRQLRSVDVRHYLSATGWQRIDGAREGIAVFRIDPDDLPEVVVPLATELDDYFYRRMAEAVADIAEYEQRRVGEVLEDLLVGDADVVRFQVNDESVADGTILISDGLNLFGGARKALLAVACAVIDPQPFYPRLTRAEATQFINTCRMSSERGSFIARVICPIDVQEPELATELLPLAELQTEAVPFSRRVTTGLMRALTMLVEKSNQDDVDQLLHENTHGLLSANLCDALLEMQPSGPHGTLRIGSRWAATRQLPSDEYSAAVVLHQDHFKAAAELANRLRPARPMEQSLFVGSVVALNGMPGTDGKMQGDVTLQLQDEDELIKARVVLRSEDYEKAGMAHLRNIPIQILGTLQRQARIHQLMPYQRFDVVGEDAAG